MRIGIYCANDILNLDLKSHGEHAMRNEVGTTLLNSLTNSSFDIGNMARVIAEAEVAGPRSILESSREKTTTELDALRYLETNLQAFQTYVTDLSSPDMFGERVASSGNESLVSVTSDSSAALGSYQIEANQLAQSHTLVANKGFTSASDTVSAGTLSINVSGQVHNITIDATNNTLEGVQNVINNGDYGITASIINNGGSYQMMFTSKETGAASEIALSGISDFDTDGFTVTSEAQDAVMVVNGLTVTSKSNTFDEVIEGVTFQLNGVSQGQVNNVTVGQDTDTVLETISSFVDVYNQLDTILDELGSYDRSDLSEEQLEQPEYEFYGDLAGNSMLRTVRAQIKDSLSGAIDEISGNFRSLADIGISFTREGTLELDSAQLTEVLNSDMQAVSNLFSKGGSSDDALINVTTGTERTQSGNYDLNITQLAERATVAGGASTVTADERVAADRVIDSSAALTIASGASFSLTVGATTQTVDLTGAAGTYTTKNDVATQIQTQIDSAFGAGIASIVYDASQSRFEISSEVGSGAISIGSSTAMTNQGFSGGAYTGEALVNLASDATFDAQIDTSTASAVTVAAGRYTQSELAITMATNINNNAEVKAAGAEVSVTQSAGVFSVTSTRFGASSNVELTNFANFANAGFTADLTDAGQSVDGTITTASGALNLGAYADFEDGRKIKISNFAVIGGNEAEVRGLEFEVLGGLTGARGTITYAEGFASQLESTIDALFETDVGLISQRIDSLNAKSSEYTEREEKIDLRYEKLLQKYQLQFSTLQSLLSSAEQTRNMLSATFNQSDN